ncbi:hypothetical protein ONZ51_g4762 [Trametes cubensis]|uniref:DUF6534 domain-containing protein n=1 Tax=Trametes cubensis TaxID=1111947 RepID=A0AAD7TVI9_9APHY|nr:hypothetical protein ONZ51_g4762 [Trametes cubensis]
MPIGPPTSDAPPTGQELGGTYGAMLISTIIAAALYGVSVLQALYYYDKFPEDHWAMKAAVALIWALDTTSIVLDSHAVYYYLIANFNNPPALLTEVWSIQVEEIITFSAVLIAQIFFIQRIYQLRPYLWYIPLCQQSPPMVRPVVVTRLDVLVDEKTTVALIIVIQIQIFQNNLWDAVPTPQFNDPIIANWVTGLIVDVSIAAVLCWYLWSEKSYIRKKTHRMINKIMIFSVNRGAFAAGTQLLTFVAKFVAPQKFVWLAFHNVLCKGPSPNAPNTLHPANLHLTLLRMRHRHSIHKLDARDVSPSALCPCPHVSTAHDENNDKHRLNSRVALRSMLMDTEQDATDLTLPSIRPNRFSDKARPRTRNHQVALQSLQFAPGRTSEIYPRSADKDSEEFGELESDYVTVSDVGAVKASTSQTSRN